MDAAFDPGTTAELANFGRVLAPLDGSEGAEAAVQWLRHLPTSRVTLLQAFEPEAAGQVQAETYLTAARERLLAPEQQVATTVVAGCPAEAIVQAASDADLVVMQTRGAGAGGRLLFGSVADRVARHSPAPTLLIRNSALTNSSKPSRIVVPLDGSLAAERALPLATSLASALGAAIHLVTVRETADGEDAAALPELSSYLEQQRRPLASRGIPATCEQRLGDPASELLAVIAPGDLLVLTTHGRGAARRWQIGSVAEKLLRQATAPVAVVRADVV
jgi:nucleotide-binding universal stress UspA family protein